MSKHEAKDEHDTPSESATNLLVGQFFHAFGSDRKTVHWQGHVIGLIQGETYLVELIDWTMGQPSYRVTCALDEFRHFQFYETCHEMKDWYERYYLPSIDKGEAA